MRALAVIGRGAEWRAAALIRALAASAASVAAARPRTPGAEDRGGEGAEFVAANGALWPNECFWLEFATGRPLLPEIPCPDCDFLVIAIPSGRSPPRAVAGVAIEVLKTESLPVRADAFGRPFLAAAIPGLPAQALHPPALSGAPLRIGIVGDDRHHREIYPAVLATLGEAAERTGVAVRPVFLAPDRPAPLDPAPLHGLILPGGSRLGEVPAQIAAAGAAIDAGLPLFGLCLGMQSMTTAILRRSGWEAAALEEVAGPGPQRSFTRLHDAGGAGLHRLGEAHLTPVPRSRLAALVPQGATLRINHRYALDDAAAAALPQGVTLHRDEDGFAAAIEMPAHPFCIGLQGHPEQGTDPALRCLWDGLLRAAARARDRGISSA